MDDLKFYLPDHLRNVRELRAIADTETPEFSKLTAAQRQMLNDQFVSTASESALRRYEQMLGIPRTASDSMNDRRFKILSKLNNQLPYSMGWLGKKLDTLFGTGNYQIIRDASVHKLAVEADVQFESVVVALYDDLRQSIPANLILETYVASSHPFAEYHACWMQTHDEIYL